MKGRVFTEKDRANAIAALDDLWARGAWAGVQSGQSVKGSVRSRRSNRIVMDKVSKAGKRKKA
ncbi:MAG: hypothetical protein LBH20_02630 [Treponema sp.]|jgi:hypothetical protein|nr:hypothetical protein [Treponema sp.]